MKILPVLFCILLIGCSKPQKETTNEYIQLFNGKDLEGWTPKIAKFKAGENYKNTFRVEDGLLKVSYAEYDSFKGEFGHLFFRDKFSDYRLRIEYRFSKERTKGAPGWAFANSGVMFHSQSIESMDVDQNFPVSLEAQFLGSEEGNLRSTMNLCTPGMHVTMADTLTTIHCIDSKSKPIMLGDWITVEIIVYGDSIIHHLVNSDTVLTYSKPIIGGDYLPQSDSASTSKPVKDGFISLQAEGHALDFRKVEYMELKRN
jgi:hypothetical protein